MKRVLEWFSAAGRKPFTFQRETWDAYLRGESGLIHAPTGVGKTLAAWLGPVIEWCTEHQATRAAPGEPATTAPSVKKRGKRIPITRRDDTEPLRVLWITPLRALAADTTESLLAPVRELDIPWSIECRTGDTSAAQRVKQRARMPTALVTTPESLSLFLSRPTTRAAFATLRCIVIDEWHELLSTKRGVQCELALARLRTWFPNLRIWGLSATLGNLDEARRALTGETGRLVSGEMPKQYRVDTLIPSDIRCFPWSGHVGTTLVDQVAQALDSAHTTLLFTNTRSQAEIWFRALHAARPDWLGRIAIHHGSLDRTIRARVETLLREGKLLAVVSTSSLDLGVDFSPVDQVLQIGSPKGIARLMQRAGRSGHQPGAQSRVLCVPAHAFELVEFAAAGDAVRRRAVEPRVPLSKPLDVLAQHLVTVALGGGFVEDELFAEVTGTSAYRELTREEWQWVMEFAAFGGPTLRAYPQHARIALDNGRWTVTSKIVERLHRLSIGTIASDSSMTVRTLRGGSLGSIEEAFVARLKPGDAFVFAGRTLEFVRVRGMVAYARQIRKASGIVPRWNGARFPLSTQLAAAVRDQLDAARRGIFDSKEVRALRPLIEMQARCSALPAPGEMLIESTRSREGWHYFLFPFEGRLAHEGLAALLALRISRHSPRTIHASANDYGLELLTPTELTLEPGAWQTLLSTDNLIDDLLACLNVTQLARRQFRDIARIAGLVFPGYPGAPKLTRQLQASSELFFDVFLEFDANNLLLDQARREVVEQQLECERIRGALERALRARLRVVATRRFSPLAFPIWAERLRTQEISSESWTQRVRRMSESLEADALVGHSLPDDDDGMDGLAGAAPRNARPRRAAPARTRRGMRAGRA